MRYRAGQACLGMAVCLSTTLVAAQATSNPVQTNGRSPRVNYMVNCQGCHLPDGRGQPGKVPSLKGELARFLDVPGGRDFIVQVPGTANSKLSDADTAALLNWLVVEMGPPRNSVFVPFSTREVARLRSQRIRDASATRAALIAQFKS